MHTWIFHFTVWQTYNVFIAYHTRTWVEFFIEDLIVFRFYLNTTPTMYRANLLPPVDVYSSKESHLTEQLSQCKDLLGCGKLWPVWLWLWLPHPFGLCLTALNRGIEADLSSVRLALHQKGSLFTPSWRNLRELIYELCGTRRVQ